MLDQYIHFILVYVLNTAGMANLMTAYQTVIYTE